MQKFSLLFFLFVTALLSAQPSVNWGPEIEGSDFDGRIIGSREGEFFAVTIEDDIPYMVRYDEKNMSTTSLTQLAIGKKVKVGQKAKKVNAGEKNKKKKKSKEKSLDFTFEKAMLLGNQFVIIYYMNEDKTTTLYAQSYDLDGSPTNQPIAMDAFPKKKRGLFFYQSEQTYYSFGYSLDSTMIFMFRTPAQDKKSQEKFLLKVWDQALTEITKYEDAFPYNNRDFHVYDYYLRNDQKLIALCRIDVDKKERGPDDPSSYFNVMSVDGKAQTVVDYKINLKEMFVAEASLRLDKDGNVFCAGLYGERKKRNIGNKGSFYYKLNGENGELIAENRSDFTQEVIRKINNSNSKKKKDQSVRQDIDLQYVLPKPDGGSILLFEESFMYTTTTRSSNGTTTTTYHYLRNDILAVNLDETGQAIWQTVIPKKQYSTNDNGFYSSFYATYVKGKTYIVFNDNIDNAKNNDFEKVAYTAGHKKTTPVTLTLDEQGEYTKELFQVTVKKDKAQYLIPFENAVKFGDSRAILSGFRQRKGCCLLNFGSSSNYKIGQMSFDGE